MAEIIGRILGGRYEVLEWIGSGGMADVYKARHTQLDRYVAVKVMHRFLTKDDQFKTRFEREARLVAQLRHPHIIQVYDFESIPDERLYYMVFEFINGPSLNEHLVQLQRQGQHIGIDEALRISRDLANALSFAHAYGVIHRDIKPANVMLDQGQRVVLTDFGLAKIIHAALTPLTASSALVGTPAYIAPEHVMGESSDARADLYSLGVMMYELLTGKLPFVADTPIGLAMRHVNDYAEPPHAQNPDVPVGISQIVMRCLAKDPAKRYMSADQLLADLSLHAQPAFDAEPTPPLPLLLTTYVPTPPAEIEIANDSSQNDTPPKQLAIMPESPRLPARRIALKRLGSVAALLIFLSGGALGLAGGFTKGDQRLAADSSALAAELPDATPSPLPTFTATTEPSATQPPTSTASETATPSETSQSATSEAQAKLAVCNVSSTTSPGVNMRSGPGTAYPVINMLKVNTDAVVLGAWRPVNKSSTWWKINYQGQQGWIWGDLVSMSGSCDDIPGAAAPPLPVSSTGNSGDGPKGSSGSGVAGQSSSSNNGSNASSGGQPTGAAPAPTSAPPSILPNVPLPNIPLPGGNSRGNLIPKLP